MVALQIRDVPEDVRQALADQAARKGQSMQAYLLNLVTEDAMRANNLAILDRFENRTDGSNMSRAEMDEFIAAFKRERDGRWDPTVTDEE